MLSEESQRSDAALIFGISSADAKPEGVRPHNSAVFVTPEAGLTGRYDKMHLVPFGEYVPSLFSFVNQVSDEAGAYTPGESLVTMPLNGHTVGTFICYESAVGHHVRNFAAAGATAFFNLSNDGYFFRTPAREQHLQLVRMRAAENRRWIVRATNNGISAVIDPAGQVREELPSFDARSARVAFGFVNEVTVFSKAGDWFPILGALLVLAALIASQLPHYTKPVKAAPRLKSKSPQ